VDGFRRPPARAADAGRRLTPPVAGVRGDNGTARGETARRCARPPDAGVDRAGWDDYRRRLPREYALELVELKPEARDRGRPVPRLLAAEAERSAPRARALSSRSTSTGSRGRRATSPTTSAHGATPRDVAFVIGSADGLDPSLKDSAAAVVALSALTLPHGLVRVLLAEQLYRAVTVLAAIPTT